MSRGEHTEERTYLHLRLPGCLVVRCYFHPTEHHHPSLADSWWLSFTVAEFLATASEVESVQRTRIEPLPESTAETAQTSSFAWVTKRSAI